MKHYTEWFDAAVHKPNKPGVYEVKTPFTQTRKTWRDFSYFDGYEWKSVRCSVRQAVEETTLRSHDMYNANVQWRGLARKPK